MTTNELLARGIGHNCLSDAYELGKADGYHKAENDYFAKTQKDREDVFEFGYETGRTFAINLILKILDKSNELGMCEYEVIERIKKLKEQGNAINRID